MEPPLNTERSYPTNMSPEQLEGKSSPKKGAIRGQTANHYYLSHLHRDCESSQDLQAVIWGMALPVLVSAAPSGKGLQTLR